MVLCSEYMKFHTNSQSDQLPVGLIAQLVRALHLYNSGHGFNLNLNFIELIYIITKLLAPATSKTTNRGRGKGLFRLYFPNCLSGVVSYGFLILHMPRNYHKK